MSTVGSIARSVLAVTTAFSVATLAFGKTNFSLVEAESALARAQRDLNAALEGGDPEKIAEAQENINVLTARIKELKDQDLEAMATNILNTGATIAIMGSSAVQASAKLGPLASRVIPTVIPALTGLGAAGWVAAAPLMIIAGIALLVAAAIYSVLTPGDQVAEFFKTFFPESAETIDEWRKHIDDAFKVHAPNAFIFLANSAMAVFDSIVLNAEQMVNGVIAGINAIISAVYRVAAFLKLPTIALIPTVSFAGVTGNRIGYLESTYKEMTARRGGSSSSPVMSPTAFGGGGGAGVTPTINITINGDVSGEELVDKVKRSLKEGLKDRGFTGY